MPQCIANRATTNRANSVKTFLLCVALFSFSSITHADANENLAANLQKLGYEQGDTIERIENYRVDGWNYIDNQHIVIYAGPSKRYLITTLSDCPDLNFAEHIGFTSTTSAVTKFDKLIVRSTGGMLQNCPIAEIKTLQKIRSQK